MKLIVKAGRYTDCSLPTASWYDIHELTAGEYPLEPVDMGHRPVHDGEEPYYLRAVVPTVLVEEFRINRLFTASSAQTTYPNQPSRQSVVLYPWEAKAGRRVLDGLGEIVEDQAPHE